MSPQGDTEVLVTAYHRRPPPHPGAQPTVSRHKTFWVNIIFFAKITKRMLCIVYFYTDPNGVPMHDSTGQVLVA